MTERIVRVISGEEAMGYATTWQTAFGPMGMNLVGGVIWEVAGQVGAYSYTHWMRVGCDRGDGMCSVRRGGYLCMARVPGCDTWMYCGRSPRFQRIIEEFEIRAREMVGEENG